MRGAAIALSLLAWPLVWVWGFGVAALTLLVDGLCWPCVAWRRRTPHQPDAPPRSKDASVIVLNYDGEEHLRVLLPTLEIAVERAPGDHEILVVDNGSSDGSVAFVEVAHPDVRVVRLPENRFFIRGNRAGVKEANGDILVFVNNDMRVEPDFLACLLEPFGEPDLFATTSRIEMAGIRVETGLTRLCWRRGALHYSQVDAPPNEALPAQWAGGGSSAFDRKKYEVIGGFEDLYEPCYVEDVSLSYQAWRNGWHVRYEHGSVVHHAHRATSSVVFGEGVTAYLEQRNRELFFWRSVTDVTMVLSRALWLPWNAFKDARRAGNAVAIRALLGALPRLPRAWVERQRGRARCRRTDRETLRIANRGA